MKNRFNYIIGFILFILGFLIAWFIKSDSGSDLKDQTSISNSPAIEASSPEIWTCSMHPQIRQNELGDCAICGMDLIPLEENNSNDPLVLEMTEEAVALADIQTILVGELSTQKKGTLRMSGKIQPNEKLASNLVAHISGRIEKLFVTYTGESVRKGQRIASVFSPELITAQKELLEAINIQELSPGLLEAARNKLKYWKISDDQIAKIEADGTIQETFDIYAQTSGVVNDKRVEVGDYIRKGEALFDLINLNRVWVLFDAYERDLNNISIGDKIEFSTPAIPNKTFQTTVTFIDPFIDPNSRIARIRTEVNNGRQLLKPEMMVQGILRSKTTANSVLKVPKSAVMWTGKRSVVYVKVPNTKVPAYQYREVQLGQGVGADYEVLDGLQAGEEVVIYGNFTIDAAAQLNNQSSMMNRISIKGKDAKTDEPNYVATTGIDFKNQLAELTESYLDLKDALVLSDFNTANEKADIFLKRLQSMDQQLLSTESSTFWSKQQIALNAHISKIKEESDIENQRLEFDFLSQAMVQTVSAFGIVGDTLYVQFCPMAIDNKGAEWISTERVIRNPYFGDKMLKCGTVTEVLTKHK